MNSALRKRKMCTPFWCSKTPSSLRGSKLHQLSSLYSGLIQRLPFDQSVWHLQVAIMLYTNHLNPVEDLLPCHILTIYKVWSPTTNCEMTQVWNKMMSRAKWNRINDRINDRIIDSINVSINDGINDGKFDWLNEKNNWRGECYALIVPLSTGTK